MTVFVLVHGAWGGAHGFRKVRGPLRAAGHEVFTPSLTGIGERAHLTSPQVSLTTHITDVVNAVEYEDLRDVVLLGFSYGGFVVTGALEYMAERVRHLVYLDAFVPDHGDTVDAVSGMGAGRGVMGLDRDWLVPPQPATGKSPPATWWPATGPPNSPACCSNCPEPGRNARASSMPSPWGLQAACAAQLCRSRPPRGAIGRTIRKPVQHCWWQFSILRPISSFLGNLSQVRGLCPLGCPNVRRSEDGKHAVAPS
jgi:pimeloyl-ACP methyl ester carboxylesterase